MSSFGRFGKNQDHAVGEFSICIKPLDGKDHARKRALTVKSWSTVKDLKDILQSLLHLPAASQRLFFRGVELRNPRTLQDSGIYRDGQTVYLASSPQDEMGKPYSLEPFLGAAPLPRSLARLLGQARRGLDRGFKPELALEGTGGTYFLQDATRQKVAVFKPQDEEPFAPNNPRDAMQGGLGGGTVSMRPGINAGESYVREVAAFLLDERHLHGVPATTLVEAKHPAFCYWDHKERLKLGSFQEFVRHDMVVEDISPSRLSPREVQKIALLDMRILNRDRNSVNILVRSRPRRSASGMVDRSRNGAISGRRARHNNSDGNIGLSLGPSSSTGAPESSGSAAPSAGGGGGRPHAGERRARFVGGATTEYELVPIDHGLCLSDELVIDWCDWCWLNWPQVKEPLDPELANYVHSLDPKATAENLGNTLNIREPCLRNLRIAETLLKEGVSAGLTLYDIACIMRREDFDKISELEKTVARATELALAAVDHQTSVAPFKKTPMINQKSLNHSHRQLPLPAPIPDSGSMEWNSDEKDTSLTVAASVTVEATAEDEGKGLVRTPSEAFSSDQQSPPTPPAREAQHGGPKPESSTDASGEDIPSLPDLRASGSSLDGSGSGWVDDGDAPLRIWAPMNLTLSRESSAAEGCAIGVGNDGGAFPSPTRSAESDTDLASPVGFWHEKFETIDARNATRRFSGWGDSGSGEEASPDGSIGCCNGEGNSRRGWGKRVSQVDGGGPSRPPREGIAHPLAVRDSETVNVGRKLFPSDEDEETRTALKVASKPNLGSMVEDAESPSHMGPPVAGKHPLSFWAAAVEPSRDEGLGEESVVGADGRESRMEEKGMGALGWRRGEAGLVVPEVRPAKSRSVTIPQVVPERARMSDAPAGPEVKATLGGALGEARPATTSPPLPRDGEHKASASSNLQLVSHGVKITRSYSYHGLGSMALYDSASRGTARFSLKKRPNENSEQFKTFFFRFLRLLVRDLVKRRHRSIVKECGARAARQAAEKSSKVAAAAAAAANAASAASGESVNAARGRADGFNIEGCLRRQGPPNPAGTSASSSRRPSTAVPAAVRG